MHIVPQLHSADAVHAPWVQNVGYKHMKFNDTLAGNRSVIVGFALFFTD